MNCPETMTCKGQVEISCGHGKGNLQYWRDFLGDPALSDSGRISTHCKSQLHPVVLSNSAESSESERVLAWGRQVT